MILQDICNDFCDRHGLPHSFTDESGAFTLLFDEQFSVTTEYAPQERELVFHAPLLPQDSKISSIPDDTAIYRKLLSVTLLGAQSKGVALSYDEESNALVAWRRVCADNITQVNQLDSLYNDFIAVLIMLNEELSNGMEAVGGASTDDEPGAPMGRFMMQV